MASNVIRTRFCLFATCWSRNIGTVPSVQNETDVTTKNRKERGAKQQRTRRKWSDITFVREYLRELQEHYKISDDEWHLITTKQVCAFHGKGLWNQYKTFHDAVKAAFPSITIKQRRWADIEYVREYLRNLQEHYQIEENEWHLVTQKQVIDFNGSGLLIKYKTVSAAVKAAFPDVNIEQRTVQHWSDIQYVKDYLQHLQAFYNVKENEWHLITTKQIKDYHGSGLLKRYRTLNNALQTVYPDIQLQVKPSTQNWKDVEYLRKYLVQLQAKYEIGDDEWHTVTNKQVKEYGGSGLLSRYHTLLNAVSIAFPNIVIQSRNIQPWGNIEYLQMYLKRLQEHYQIAENEWHLITTSQIREFHGDGMLKRYKTFRNALKVAFPESEVSTRGWRNIQYVREYLRKLKEYYKISDDEWHLITYKQVIDFNGAGLMRRYKTLHVAVNAAFPNIIVRSRTPFWDHSENVIDCMKQLEKAMFITRPEDWYRVSTSLIRRFGGGNMLATRPLIDLLRVRYPEVVKWDDRLLKVGKKKAEQFYLKNVVVHLFPNGTEVLEDYLHPELSFRSGRPVEIDLYLPSYNLGIEYQGQQHFEDVPFFGPVELYRARDNEKQLLCSSLGIHLVSIPYWWNHSVDDLSTRISHVVKW